MYCDSVTRAVSTTQVECTVTVSPGPCLQHKWNVLRQCHQGCVYNTSGMYCDSVTRAVSTTQVECTATVSPGPCLQHKCHHDLYNCVNHLSIKNICFTKNPRMRCCSMTGMRVRAGVINSVQSIPIPTPIPSIQFKFFQFKFFQFKFHL